MKAGELELADRQSASEAQQRANQILAQFPKNPDGTYDSGALVQQLAQANVPPEMQDRIVKSIDGVNGVISSFQKAKFDHAADLANAILTDHNDGEPITPETVHLALAMSKSIGLATDEDEAKFTQIMDQGADPEKVLKALRAQSSKYKSEKPEEFTLSPGQTRFGSQGQPIASVPATEKPASSANVGSFEDYVLRTYGENPTSAQILAGRKAYNQADDKPPAVNVSVNGAGGIGTLDSGGLELAATDYRLTHRLPARNAQQNGAIISAAAKQAQALGASPVQTIQRQAAYAGDAKALAKMQSMSASAEAFESKAIAQTDIIKELSAKVPRTTYPIINSALQSGRTKITGDENATKLANAIETFSEEYAKIMNGATGSAAAATDSSRSAAKRLINTGMNQGTMQGVLDLMKREMALTISGYDSVINHITDRMGGAPSAPQSTAPAVGGTTEKWERGADGKMHKATR